MVDFQILTQLVVIQMATGDRQAWPLDEIEILKPGQATEQPAQEKTARTPVNKKQDDAVSKELADMGIIDQKSLGDKKAPQRQSSQNNGNGSQQKSENSQQPGKRRGNKNQRRRPKNKQGGSPNTQNAQSSQKNPPAQNKNRQENKQKPSNGNTTPPSGE